MNKSIFVLICLISTFCSFSCSERDRNNPLDPQNSQTRGKPANLSVISREKSVNLTWDYINLAGLETINIYRKTTQDSIFILLGITEPSSSSYIDDSVDYGRTYQYQITALANDYESPPSRIVAITPGPTYTWVADQLEGVFSRLNHDMQFRFFNYSVSGFPSLVAVSPRERSAWAFSRFSNTLYKINQFGSRDVIRDNLFSFTDMAVDTIFNELWFSVADSSALIRLNHSGFISFEARTVAKPGALAVDSRDHSCWVIDNDTRQVIRYSYSGIKMNISAVTLEAPKDIAINSNKAVVWIADSTHVFRLDNMNNLTVNINGFYNAAHVGIDNIRDVIWVIDMEAPGEPASLIKMTENGDILFEIERFGFPASLAVNQYDGSCLVADTGLGTSGLWRVSEDGSSITSVGGFISPSDVAIEYH